MGLQVPGFVLNVPRFWPGNRPGILRKRNGINRMSLRKKIRQFGKKERIMFLILTDILLINLSAFLALFLRFELNWSDTTGSEFFPLLLRLALPNTLITLAIFAVMQLYMSLWDYAGTVEIERIVSASALSACVWALPLLFKNGFLPRSFPILYGVLLCLLTACSRFSYRLMRRARLARRHTAYARTMLIGAGQAGAAILREFAFSRFSRNKVVCLLDDDPPKQGQRLMGIRIVRARKDIADAAEKYRVSEIVIAIPTLSAASKKELLHLCSLTGCKLKWIPGLYQIANEDIRIQQIRDVDIEDLLEREVVSIDMEGIAERIRRRRQHRQRALPAAGRLSSRKAGSARYIREQRLCRSAGAALPLSLP